MRSLRNHHLPVRRGYDCIELLPVSPTRWLIWWETNGAGVTARISNGDQTRELAVDHPLVHRFVDFDAPGLHCTAQLLDADGRVIAHGRPRSTSRPGCADHRLKWRHVLDPDNPDGHLDVDALRDLEPGYAPFAVPPRADVSSHSHPPSSGGGAP